MSNVKKYSLTATVGSLLYFPVVFIYLELIFHIYMRLQMKYVPLIIILAISIGCLCSVFISTPFRKFNKIMAILLTAIPCVLLGVEMVCKTVLSQYYQLLSSAGTAANNKLTDYMGAIISGIIMNLGGLFLIILPIIAILLIEKKRLLNFGRKGLLFPITMLALFIVFDILGILMLHLPWSGDITPKQLYYSDTDVDDQVEQLGVFTMLRLDVKHSLFGAKGADKTSAEDFNMMKEVLGGEEEKVSGKEEEVSIEPNSMDIDLEDLAKSSDNEDVQWLCEYFNSVTPTTKNQYTGIFKDYNVIFITAEGFTGYMIDEELTPTLYKLSHEGFVFNNFYTPLHYTSTSGGEFQNLTGLYPKSGNPISMKAVGDGKNNMYFTLAQQFNRLGYQSLGYHANDNDTYDRSSTHTVLGYTWKQGYNGLDIEKNSNNQSLWPQSDKYTVEHTIDEYINSEEPFNVYYMSISGHMPYTFVGNSMSIKNEDLVENLDFSEETRAYIAANMELEYALQYLVERLENAGIADKTLLVLAPDHIPYFNVNVIEELAGKQFGSSSNLENLNESDMDFDVYKNTLILWTASMEEPVQVDKICGQVDILPTLSNLLGLEYDSRLLAGSDILSDSTPLVIFSSRSFKTDKGIYNRYTESFQLSDGVTMSDEEKEAYVEAMKKVVTSKLNASTLVVETDFYNQIFKDTAIYGKLAGE